MKARRQAIILELIDREALHSQEQLRRRLRQRGFEATQATISRDIKELGLVKRAGDGAYQRAGADATNPETALSALERAAAEFLRSVERVQQLVVVRTGRGQAQALAEALDRAQLPEAVGTIAGDDTILVIARGARARRRARQAARRTIAGSELTWSESCWRIRAASRRSIAIPWLAEQHGAEVIAVTVDLGQGKEVLEEIRDRALATGAVRAHVVDVRDEFARDYVAARAEGRASSATLSPVAAALAHPLIAQKLVEIAGIEQATAVAHGDPAGSGVAARSDDSRARPDDDGAGAGRRVGHDAGAAARLRARAARHAAGRVQRPRRPRVGAAGPSAVRVGRAGVRRHRVRARRADRRSTASRCRCST